MNNTPLLTIRGLKIDGKNAQGITRLVDGVDLELRRGEVLGIIGESGAGKSTLGLAAMGYTRDGCRIIDGEINFDGIDLVRCSESVSRALRGRRIAYVAQSAAASFNPAHRIIRQHCETAIVRNVMIRSDAEADAVNLYRKMHLPDPERIGQRYPHEVSGGQLQRAMTVMGMSCRPDIIIFDEPTTALDVTTQIGVLKSIREIVAEFGTAALYISHDLALVAQMADRIMVLRNGRVVEVADTHTMLSDPKEEYTRSLWAVRALERDVSHRIVPTALPVLSIKNVSARYGAVPVLKDVSFDMHAGSVTAVVGESGSGKSTLAKVITGILKPTAGTVGIGEKVLAPDFRTRSKADLRHIQLVYQMPDTALNPRHTIRDTIGRPLEFYLGLRGKDKEQRINALLEQIELDPAIFLKRSPAELSGGQKQRVGLARALAAEPSVLICDEVTSALDQLVAADILAMLGRIQHENGLAIMFITHDLAIVRAIADNVVVMQRGEIVEQGKTEALLALPTHAYTSKLLASVPQMDEGWLDRQIVI